MLRVEQPIPSVSGTGISHFPQLQQRGALAAAWGCLWERMGCLEGLALELSLLSCVCSHSHQSCSCLGSTAGSWEPVSKHPALGQGITLAPPGEPRHAGLLRCALRKKRNSVLPTPRDAATQSWPSISCLPSWAQWEHFGLIPAPGSCSRGQAWSLLSDCPGVSCPAFRRAWNTFGSPPLWDCHMFAFPMPLSPPASTKEKQDQHTLPARRPLARAEHSSGIKPISRASAGISDGKTDFPGPTKTSFTSVTFQNQGFE